MPDITVDVIREIQETAKPLTVEVNGKTYATEDLRLIRPPYNDEALRPVPARKTVNSLDALVALIQREALEIYPSSDIYVTCSAFNRVDVFTNVFTEDKRWERQDLYCAESTDAPGWKDSFMDFEKAVIALRSRFAPNDGQGYLLDLLSKISNQADVQTNDNGMTQTTEVRKGIMLLGKETVRPIVPLRPYRTFQEVEQPESEFLVRVREAKPENEIGILEADGGMWKLKARKIIREYLDAQLQPDENERIVLTL